MFRVNQITKHLLPVGNNMHLSMRRTISSRPFPSESFGIDLDRDLTKGTSISLHLNTEVANATKPLRVAISGTGLSKDLIRETRVKGGRSEYSWSPNQLINVALIGEDILEATGEDALIVGYCDASSNKVAHTFEYVNSTLDKNAFFHNTLPVQVASPANKEPVESIVFGVADGVGGMASYGDRNQTAFMSHELLSKVRNNLTRDTYSAKALLQRSWRELNDHSSLSLGACTATIGLIKPMKGDIRTRIEYNEYLSPTAGKEDDGQRALLDCVNVGDSSIVAFRPIKNDATVEYEVLALTWPLHHKHNSNNPPPMQLVLAKPMGPDFKFPPIHTQETELSTSSGARQTEEPTSVRSSVSADYNLLRKTHSDQPWLGAEARAVLQRGDIVMAFSDGVGDNLRHHIFTEPLIHACAAAVKYIHPQYKDMAEATKRISDFKTIGHDTDIPNQQAVEAYQQASPAQVKDSLTCEDECVIAGNYTSLLASTVIRLCQKSVKVDDMTLVVAVVY